jgi:hypothetical protein
MFPLIDEQKTIQTRQNYKVLQRFRGAALLQTGKGLAAVELLGRFIERRDEAPFAAIARRRGGLTVAKYHNFPTGKTRHEAAH